MMTSPNSIVYEVVPVHIGIFNCSEYSARKGAIVHSSGVNVTGCMFPTKNNYLRGYPYLLSTHYNGLDPVSLKSSQ